MIARTVYKPSDFWPAGAASGMEYQTQVNGTVTYLDDHFASETEANAAFPYIARSSGAWDPLELGDTWADWSMDAACIMEAFEHAAEESAYWEDGKQPGIIEFDPGVYHVSMGHVWFYSAVQLKGAEHCRFDGCMKDKEVFNDAGTNSSWWKSDSARAVLTLGIDTSHRRWLYSGTNWNPTYSGWQVISFSDYSMNLPCINNYENVYDNGIGNAQGAGIRFLQFHDMTYRDIRVSGPFKYGIIFCAEAAGCAFSHFYLNKIHGCLISLKWRGRVYMNDCNIWCGSFTQRQSPITDEGWDPFTNPTVILDSDNTPDNPNETYDPTITATPGHWEFMNVSFEVEAAQFMRASGISQWHFHNSRWEAADRPFRTPYLYSGLAEEVGNWQGERMEWYLRDVQHCSIKGGSSQFMAHGFPSGILGRGFTFHQSYHAPSFESARNIGSIHPTKDYKLTEHIYHDLLIGGDKAGIIMDSDNGRRYRLQLADQPFSSNNDYQVIAKPLPKVNLQWRNYDEDGEWGQEHLSVSGGTNIQIKNLSTNYDWCSVYIRRLYPTEDAENAIVYTRSDFDDDGVLKVSSMQPLNTLGTHLIFATIGKYIPGTYTVDEELGTDYIRYPMVILASGVE